MASSSQILSQGTSQQAASVEEVTSSLEEMSASVTQNADNSRQMEQMAVKGAAEAEESGRVVGETVDAMKAIAEARDRPDTKDPAYLNEWKLLFTMVNLARFLDIESEEVLAQTVDRFTRRFHHIEARLREANKTFDQSSLEEMDRFWDEAKQVEKQEK